jgi:hypothetical protein
MAARQRRLIIRSIANGERWRAGEDSPPLHFNPTPSFGLRTSVDWCIAAYRREYARQLARDAQRARDFATGRRIFAGSIVAGSITADKIIAGCVDDSDGSLSRMLDDLVRDLRGPI